MSKTHAIQTAFAIVISLLVASCELLARGRPPSALPEIHSFTAAPTVVAPGDPALLSWQVTGGDTTLTLRQDQTALEVDVTGLTTFETPNLDEPTTFHLSAENVAGFATSYIFVSVLGYASKEK